MTALMILAIWLALAIATAFWLRHRFTPFQRLNDFNWACLVLADILAGFVLFWLAYLAFLIDVRPPAGVTISAFCGWQADEGRRWAIIARTLIDGLFRLLTSQRDHCGKAFISWRAPLARKAA